MTVGANIPALFHPAISTTASYTPSGGSPSDLEGVFFSSYSDPYGVDNVTDSFVFQTVLAPSMADGDALQVDGVNYRISGTPQKFAFGLSYARLTET